MARTDPDEQESIVLLPELEGAMQGGVAQSTAPRAGWTRGAAAPCPRPPGGPDAQSSLLSGDQTVRIEHRPCPRCQIPHTARFSEGVAVCLNCQATWDPHDPAGTLVPARRRPPAAPVGPAAPAAPAPAPFSAPERARLTVYRDAVRAGFYNEGLEAPALPEEQDAA